MEVQLGQWVVMWTHLQERVKIAGPVTRVTKQRLWCGGEQYSKGDPKILAVYNTFQTAEDAVISFHEEVAEIDLEVRELRRSIAAILGTRRQIALEHFREL